MFNELVSKETHTDPSDSFAHWAQLVFLSQTAWKRLFKEASCGHSMIRIQKGGTNGRIHSTTFRRLWYARSFCPSDQVDISIMGTLVIGLFTNFMRPVFLRYFLNHLVFHNKTSSHY